jgi:branched-chain amino acid transport system ATP-binding protein
MSPVLQTNGLTLRYGRFMAIDNVSITLQPGRRYGVLGPNGAGKTSLLNLLSGTARASAGSILLDGIDITAQGPAERRRAGLGRSFQKTSVFMELTVLDNLRLAAQSYRGWRLFDPWTPRLRDREGMSRVIEFAEQVGLQARLDTCASELSYGELRQLEVGLALATEPRVLLLDEPTAGMSRSESDQAVELIRKVTVGKTLVMVEHDMSVVFGLADRISVLVYGEVIATDVPAMIRGNSAVQEAYLGTSVNTSVSEGH